MRISRIKPNGGGCLALRALQFRAAAQHAAHNLGKWRQGSKIVYGR
jgi:hypothetical protein